MGVTSATTTRARRALMNKAKMPTIRVLPTDATKIRARCALIVPLGVGLVLLKPRFHRCSSLRLCLRGCTEQIFADQLLAELTDAPN